MLTLASVGLDVQLKILQTLPSLLQNYSEDLSGELIASTLEICATLQSSKTAAVSNTAAATLQQLVVSAFEKVSNEDSKFLEKKFHFLDYLLLTSPRKPSWSCACNNSNSGW